MPGGNLLQPPASLVGAIITAVPVTVLVELAGGAGRSAIASEFKAGNTPAWYQNLPEGVKSYVSALASQINGGKVDLNATPTPVDWASPKTTSTGGDGSKGDVKSSKSKGMAAQPTAAPLGISVAAAVGILGVALALWEIPGWTGEMAMCSFKAVIWELNIMADAEKIRWSWNTLGYVQTLIGASGYHQRSFVPLCYENHFFAALKTSRSKLIATSSSLSLPLSISWH
jgi:hypothetical protein